MRVEPGAFSSVFEALPIPDLPGYISNMEYLINIKIENMLHGLGGNFLHWVLSNFSASFTVYGTSHKCND